MDINAETAASVNALLLAGNTFNDTVYFCAPGNGTFTLLPHTLLILKS